MRNPPPALMPIFRSQHQAEILARLFLHPGTEYTLSELAREIGASPGSIHAEIERLTRAGLVLDRMVGRSRVLRANTEARAAGALTELLTLSFGPEVVIAEELGGIADVELVVIYGSWARRYRGEVGPEPGDVDVMVVGKPDRAEVYDAAGRAEDRLKLPVNPTVRSIASWVDETDALVRTAKPDGIVVSDRSGGEGA